MSREIKFRAWCETDDGTEMIYFGKSECDNGLWFDAPKHLDSYLALMQYTGLKDKHGKEIYEGDYLKILSPYRTTQTHTGDNIPNGSYTEPMEANIKIEEGVVVFDDGAFRLKVENDDNIFSFAMTLSDYSRYWQLNDIEEAIQWRKPSDFIFDDPEEGDLQYLMELAKVETPEELCELFSGIEIVGNIYENSELIDDGK